MMHFSSIIGCIQHISHMLCCLNTSPARTQLCELLLLGASRSSSSTKHADAGSPALCGNLLGSSGRPSAGCLRSRQQSDSCTSSSSQSTSFSLRLYGGAQFSQSYVHWVHMVQFYQQSVSPRAPHSHFATRATRRCSIWYLGALTLFPGHRETVGVGVHFTRLRPQCFADSLFSEFFYRRVAMRPSGMLNCSTFSVNSA